MSQEKTTLEVIAPTVEEAVQKGLAQLNLPQDAVEVEVLDAGSRGLFGLGSRQARIRLTIKSRPGRMRSACTGVRRPAAEPRRGGGSACPASKRQLVESRASRRTCAETSQMSADGDEDETLRVSREVVTDLLEKMKVRAKVTAAYRSPEDDSDEPVVLVNVEGQ